MADITLPVYVPPAITAAGIAVPFGTTVTSADTGHWIPGPTGLDLLFTETTGSGGQAITIVGVPEPTLGRSESVISSSTNARRLMGPFPPRGFMQTDGLIDVLAGSLDNFNIALIAIPKRSRYGSAQPAATGVYRAPGFRSDISPGHIHVDDGDLIAIATSGEGNGVTFAGSGLDLILARATTGTATGIRVSGQPDPDFGRSDDLPVTTLTGGTPGAWFLLPLIPSAGFADSDGLVTVYTTAAAAEFFVVALG